MMISGVTTRSLRALCMLLLLCLVAASPLWHQDHDPVPLRVGSGHDRQLADHAAGDGFHRVDGPARTCPICLSQHLLSLSLLAAPVEVHTTAGLPGTFGHFAAPPVIALSRPDRARAPPLA